MCWGWDKPSTLTEKYLLSFLSPTWDLSCPFNHREDPCSSSTITHVDTSQHKPEHIPATSSRAKHHIGWLKAGREAYLRVSTKRAVWEWSFSEWKWGNVKRKWQTGLLLLENGLRKPLPYLKATFFAVWLVNLFRGCWKLSHNVQYHYDFFFCFCISVFLTAWIRAVSQMSLDPENQNTLFYSDSFIVHMCFSELHLDAHETEDTD